jgi:hypothetical protein
MRVTRLRRQSYRKTLEVYVDGRMRLHLAPRESGDIEGTGRPQEIVVKSTGFVDSEPVSVTDPQAGQLLGILVTYAKHRHLFARTVKTLKAEVMGPPLAAGAWDPP